MRSYSSRCSASSEVGASGPSIRLPPRSTTAICSARISPKTPPVGVTTTWSSTRMLTLPAVPTTRPSAASRAHADATCSRAASSTAMERRQVRGNPQSGRGLTPIPAPRIGHSVVGMDNVWHRQTSLMDRSGLGLLPGIALAFVVALFLIAAITLHTWWAVGIGLVGSIGGAVVVIAIVLKTVMSDDGEYE